MIMPIEIVSHDLSIGTGRGSVAVGGILKPYLRERKREDLTAEPGEETPEAQVERLYFGWKQEMRRYKRI